MATITKWTGLGPGSSVIEVGCGGGAFGLALAVLGASVVLLDIDENVMASAQANVKALSRRLGRQLPVQLVTADLLHYDGEEKFDMCISDGLIEHWRDPEQRLTVLRAHAALVGPGGFVAVTIPNNYHPWSQRWEAQGWPWTKSDNPLCEAKLSYQELAGELQRAGLSDVMVDGYLVWDTLSKWPKSKLRQWLVRALKLILGYDRVGPWPLPRRTRLKWGTCLLGIGRRPG